MATLQRNIREKLFIFKRTTHDIVVEIFQTCSDIAKTDAKSQKLKLTKCQKNNLKNLEDSKPRIIETIEKINPKIQIKLKNQKIRCLQIIETKYI